jgi:hypothetical protein
MTIQSRLRISVLVFSLHLVGCNGGARDPGWTYKSITGRPVHDAGRGYELPESEGIRSKVSAGLFAGTLDASLEVRNNSQDVLSVPMHALGVRDATGTPLRRRVEFAADCGGKLTDDICELSFDQTCHVAAGFNAKPFRGRMGVLLRERNTDLSNITIYLTSKLQRHANGEFDVRIPMVWD